jgi:hypothetical protein
MKKIVLLLLSASLLAAKDGADAKKPKPRFPLGKETTYVTEPLDADGYIDYAAALNERLRRGVTPENNANVLLWRALGPHPEAATMPDEFFKWLGIKAPPEKGDYFISMSRYAREQLKLDRGSDVIAIEEELARCAQRTWKASEHPRIAAWLKANEKPIAVVREATKRTHYYSPLVPKRTKKGQAPLIGALMPSVQKCRELSHALAVRALLRINEGQFEDAWQDLLACHRIGRLVAQGATGIELLVGIAIDSFAGRADLVYLERVECKSEQIKERLRELRQLTPMPVAADKVDFGERFLSLDAVTLLARYGPEGLEDGGMAQPEPPNLLERLLQPAIDWEPVLRIVNGGYNRIVKAMRIQDRETRDKMLKQIGKDLDELCKNPAKSVRNIFQIRKAIGEDIANVLVGLWVPPLQRVQDASDRCEQLQNNLYVAFALAAYHRDHGRYPKELAALVPKYLDKIPKDLFSEKLLIYRPSENGYLLYSVGLNCRDEQGRTSDDEPQGDDLSIRMPLPKLKQK